MTANLPALDTDFKTATDGGLVDISRHLFVALSFTQEAVGDFFDLNLVRFSLTENETLQKYLLSAELMESADEQDKDRFLEMRMTVNESLVALMHDAENGLGAPADLEMNIYAEEGFTISTPALEDLVALYTNISTLYDLKWEDPKACLQNGFEYSLADIKAALALLPENDASSDDDEDDVDSRYDRPVDMGLPKAWLQ